MAKHRIRIIRKTKEGALLDMKEQGKKLYPWEEFNKYYNIVDNVWAESNELLDKLHDELEEDLSNAVTWFLMLRSAEGNNDPKSLSYSAHFGGIIINIQKKYGFSMMQVRNLIKRRIDLINDPKTWKETPEEYRERHARQAKEKAKREKDELSYRHNTISNATESMANVKGADKLRDLFK